MLRLTLFFFLTILSPLLAKAPQYWKHSAQQGGVGACHTFATVALIEAEWYRSHRKHIDLSERDLFVRHYLSHYKSVDDCIRTQLTQSLSKKLDDNLHEAGHITADFQLAQKHGIASERELPYEPLFSNGVNISMGLLRHHRNLAHTEAILHRGTAEWTPEKRQQIIQRRSKKLRSVRTTLQLPQHTKTRNKTRLLLAAYQLVQTTPKTTAQAKAFLIKKTRTQPVAVDITNLHEILPPRQKHLRNLHSRHSLVVSHYHPKTDTFTIRSSTFKGAKKVPANTLSRGCYQLYHLEKK